MKKLYIAVLSGAVLAIASSATAADLGARSVYKAPPAVAPVSIFSWTGPYAGLFAGYGWAKADATEPFDARTAFFYNYGGSPYSFNADGFFGGGTLGYNWQSGAFVLGLEGEIGYLGLKGSRISPNGIAIGTPDTTTTFKSDLYGAVTGRLGMPVGNVLYYAKGGGAVLNAKATTVDPCIAPPAGCGVGTLSMTGNKTMFGWTVGGGIEWAYAANWTAKVEYAYFNFGEFDTAGVDSFGGHMRQSIDATAHTVKVGLNYRWAAP